MQAEHLQLEQPMAVLLAQLSRELRRGSLVPLWLEHRYAWLEHRNGAVVSA